MQRTMLVHVTSDTIDAAEQLRLRLQRVYLALTETLYMQTARRIGVENELEAAAEACHELAGRIYEARREAEGYE